MSHWIQHYAVTKITLDSGNAFKFASGDCQMIPLNIDTATLVLVEKSGFKQADTFAGGPYDLKCIEYAIVMVNLETQAVKIQGFFHQFTRPAYLDKRQIFPAKRPLFQIDDMDHLVSSKLLKGYKGVQFID